MIGKIILLIIILFLSLEYICSQKEILVSTYHIRKTKIVKIVESILAMLGVLAYYMNLIDYFWLSKGLLIAAVILANLGTLGLGEYNNPIHNAHVIQLTNLRKPYNNEVHDIPFAVSGRSVRERL